MHLTNKQFLKLIPLLVGVIVVVGTLIFFNLNRAAINNQLAALDLIPKPEKLTELYFDNNTGLPSSVPSNHVISFTFVIHDLEATDYQYVYNVSVIATNGSRRIIDSGNVLIKDNQFYTKSENFKLTDTPGRQDVVVELTNKRQSIDFWIGN
ncbi:hypothetical protein ccbrp13_30890 [Ktedonobacteria bacterium brp13]|nr:hypothetical protein ccbrp13_30890 [Ktedonobacteria bacterium brp13]